MSSCTDLAFRSVAGASLVLIFGASCSRVAGSAVAEVAAVDSCNFVVADARGADEFSLNLRVHPETQVVGGLRRFPGETVQRSSSPDNSADHSPADSDWRGFDNNYYSYSDIEAIGSCTDHRHSSRRFQCPAGAANANGFVVSNFRRRHCLTRMPTRDVALKSLVANTDASAGCRFAGAADSPSQRRFELALVSVVCLTYRVDSVMLSAFGHRDEGEKERKRKKKLAHERTER